MQQAVNPQTGEVLFLVNNQWVPPAQVAQNEAGQKAYLVNNQWIIGGAVPPKNEEPEAAAATTETPVAEQAASAEQPGIISRIGSFLTEPLAVSERDKVIAGSIKKGIKQLGEIPAQIQYAELSGLQNAREAEYGKNLENAPPEVKARHEETAKKLQELQKEAALAGVERKNIEKEYGTNVLAKKLEDLSQSPEYKDADFLGKSKIYGSALIDNAGEIPGYVGTLGLESLPTSIAVAATALLTRFLPGGGSRAVAASTAGGTSAFMEFGGNYADLRAQGMEHEEAWEKAAVKSGVIGFFDGVSFGAAGKAADVVIKNFEKGALRAAGKEAVVGSSKQGAMGAAGEGLGSVVIGEEADPIKMGAEFAGEFFTAPLDAAAAYRGNVQPPAPTPQPAVPVQAATGETIPLVPLDTAQKQQQAIATGQIPPTIEAGVTPPASEQQVLSTRAEQLVNTIGVSREDALEIAQGELARGELSVRGPENIGAVAGANEPSLSLPSERGGAAQGVAAPSAEGLADTVGGVGKPDVGAGVERGALTTPAGKSTTQLRGEIKAIENNQELLRTEGKAPKEGTRRAKRFAKLEEQRQELIRQWADADATERGVTTPAAPVAETPAETTPPAPPAPPTFGKLEKKQKTEVINQAKALWQSREINLPIESAWENLPKWKQYAFAQQLFDEGENFLRSTSFEQGTPYVNAMNDIAKLPTKKKVAPAAAEFVGPKRPPGRPRRERTEANQAINLANRAADSADLNRAARGVNASIKAATKQAPATGTVEQQQAAQAQIASDRLAALYNLFLATKNKYYRDVERSGLKAKAFLESEAVTPKERMELQQRFEFEQKQREQKTQRSAIDTPVTAPYQREALRQELIDFIGGVENVRVLQIVQSWNDLPSGVRFQAEMDGGTSSDKGFVQDGVAYLIADNIQEGTGRAVFMHEVGVHLGLESLLPTRLLNNLVGQIRTWAQRNDGSLESRIAQQALDRVERAGTSPAQQNSEAIAYFLEGAMNAGVTPQSVKSNTEFGKFIQQIYNLFRNAVRKLGLATNRLTAQDIVDMGFGAARLEMIHNWHGTAATFRNFNHDFLSSGEGLGKLMAGQMFGAGSYSAERHGTAYTYLRGDVKNKTAIALKNLARKYEDFFYVSDVVSPETLEPVVFANSPVTEKKLKELKGLGVDNLKVYRPATNESATIDFKDETILGNMMRVDFKIAPDEWLNWDKPVSEQSPLVQEKLEKIRVSILGINDVQDDVFNAFTGKDIIETIQKRAQSALFQVHIFDKIPAAAQAVKQGNYKLAASMYLDSLGIKGTQFKDARSRTEYNFVIKLKDGLTTVERLIEIGALDYSSASTLAFYDGDITSAIESTERDIAKAEEDGDDYARGTTQIALDHLNELAVEYVGVEDASVKTHNYVVFNDKNIIRVASLRGAKQEQTQFSKNFDTFDDVTTDSVDPSFNRFTSPTQAANYVQRSGTEFERVLAGQLKKHIKGVQYIVVNSQADIPNVQVMGDRGVLVPLSEAFKDTSGMYAESYDEATDTTSKYLMLRGENFGDPTLQGLGSNMFLHEALHAATINKLATFKQLMQEGRPVPADLQRLVTELGRIMIRAQDKYSEMKAESLIGGPPVSAQLAFLFDEVKVGTDMDEFVSYGMTNRVMQQFLMGVEGATTKEQATGFMKSLFTRFTNALREAFNMDDKHSSAMQDLILVTGGILEGQKQVKAAHITPAMAARKKRAISLNEHKLQRSKSTDAERLDAIGGLGKLSKNADKLLSAFDRRLDKIHPKALQQLLHFIPTPVLNKWVQSRMPSLVEVNTLVERMGGMRSKLIAAAKVISDDIATFVKADKAGIGALADALHLSRLNNFSPLTYSSLSDALINDQRLTDAKATFNAKVAQNTLQGTPESNREMAAAKGKVTARENEIKAVYAKWDALGSYPNGQDLYKRMLTYYKDTFAVYRQMLDRRIERLRIPGAANDPKSPKGKLMAEINKLYMMEMPEAYAPFMRRGDYRLDFKGDRGREVYMFDTSSQRDDFIAAEAQKRNISRSEFFTSNEAKITDNNGLEQTENELRNGSELLKGIFQVIDAETQNAPLTKLDLDELKDSVYQFWLKSGPEESIRKQFLHSRNVTGFSSDVYQNFVDYSTRAAVAISRLRFQDEIYANIEQARDSLAGNPVMNKLEKFVDELELRAKQELFPPEQSGLRDASRKFKQFAFMYAMTSAATAMVQMFGLVSTVLPFLTGEYGLKSSAILVKYMGVMTGNVGWSIGKSSMGLVEYIGDKLNIKDNGDVTFVAPTLAESDYIKNDSFRSKVYQEFVARGAIDNTFISNITDMNKVIKKESDNVLVRGLNTGASVMTASFNTLERLTRQVTLMTIFEAEYAKSNDFDKAINAAIEKTNSYTGNASTYNTPSVFKGPIMSVLWQFKQFPLGIFQLLVGMGYKMLAKGQDLKERVVAAKMLATFYLMTFLFAGAQGLPGYDLATGAVDLTLNKLIPIVDDSGKMERVIKNPGKANDSDRRFREDWLPEYFGDARIKGIDGRYHLLSEVMETGPASALTGWNLSGRMSMNGLLWRSSRSGDTWAESVLNFAKENLAPSAGMGMTFIDGAQQVIDGEVLNGAKKMTPAPIKSLLAAYQLSSEGLVSGKGDVVIPKEELGRFAVAGQALGFQPTEVATAKRQSTKSYEEDKAVKDSQKRAYKKLDNAILNPEAGENALSNALNVIRQHNLRYASYPKDKRIDTDTMLEHIDNLVDSKQITVIQGSRIKNDMLKFKGRERLQAVPQPRGESGPFFKRGE